MLSGVDIGCDATDGLIAAERIFIELMTSDRKLEASREGSK